MCKATNVQSMLLLLSTYYTQASVRWVSLPLLCYLCPKPARSQAELLFRFRHRNHVSKTNTAENCAVLNVTSSSVVRVHLLSSSTQLEWLVTFAVLKWSTNSGGIVFWCVDRTVHKLSFRVCAGVYCVSVVRWTVCFVCYIAVCLVHA